MNAKLRARAKRAQYYLVVHFSGMLSRIVRLLVLSLILVVIPALA
jgi:hypothetical protein